MMWARLKKEELDNLRRYYDDIRVLNTPEQALSGREIVELTNIANKAGVTLIMPNIDNGGLFQGTLDYLEKTGKECRKEIEEFQLYKKPVVVDPEQINIEF
jgi:hypothetical protein